jgi:hypothetical protein
MGTFLADADLCGYCKWGMGIGWYIPMKSNIGHNVFKAQFSIIFYVCHFLILDLSIFVQISREQTTHVLVFSEKYEIAQKNDT